MTPDSLARWNRELRSRSPLEITRWAVAQAGGRAVLSTRWVADSLQPDEVASVVHTSDGAVRRGRYQWFLTLDGCCYFAKGYNGQYVFVDRAHDVVIVRFGEGYGEVSWTALFTRMAESL